MEKEKQKFRPTDKSLHKSLETSKVSVWVGNTNYSESCVGIKDENIDVGGNISNSNLNLQNYQ